MSQDSNAKDAMGKITLTWGDKPGSPRTQTTHVSQMTKPQAAPAPTPEPEPEPEPAPAPQPEETESQPTPAAEEKAPTPAKKKSGAFLDSLLVLALVGIIGGGAWYMHQQMQMYRVPSPLELAQSEHLELCKQHEQLQDAAYKADEKIHMSGRLAYLESQLADIKRRIAEEKQGIQAEAGRIQALQQEIRKEDKTARSVAKGMLIGLPIGNASTTSGKVYANATIHRLEHGRITLRTPNGQVCFPTSQLVKDNLPDMARYAFGIDDMVDMTDFETTSGKPEASKRRKGKLITPKAAATQPAEQDFEPASGAPVVDAQNRHNSTAGEGALIPGDDGSWQAPQEALPIGE